MLVQIFKHYEMRIMGGKVITVYAIAIKQDIDSFGLFSGGIGLC